MQEEFNPKIPLYYQIKERIISEIEANIYEPGDQIPPELQLAEKYGVSRPTIRQAIMELVNEGRLTRTRGRGTFVSNRVITNDAQQFTTFFDPIAEAENPQFSLKVIDVKLSIATKTIASDLKIPVNAELVEISLLISDAKEPIAYRLLRVPLKTLDIREAASLDHQHVLKLIQHKLETETIKAIQSFKSVIAFQKEAKLLSIYKGDPLTLWQGIIYDQNEVPLSLVQTYYRGDRIQFMIKQEGQERLPITLQESRK